ncbi:DUF2515 family protein [Peribacillus psychrosaccharolyticus]|uniref:DUF2515 family protein n=2 Tax=Peribacillus psychrosaccharolyticus TaxID=1407 RepID=A0A974NN42_PERPY|nr:DUF2515 family protein [Peribacillus psychrosaccharolyticus]MEC2057248.1 DUF2515 family protein [Peribacillus psychrosaccharolyticus]MED3742923.1 DUF2515 family protein [Peribacillus psychrosaccharolyticus]QQT01011.1 DUF2515 family protein [Peribacillus psychrosaccharolyticus]
MKLKSCFLHLLKSPEYESVLSVEEYENLKRELMYEYEQPSMQSIALLPNEFRIIKDIRNETAKYNRNNLTRTEAYLTFYKKHPEIHWALLAHMVSRNGGYHMTDLKGDLMNHLFKEADRRKFFRFLEDANAAIFADAYPQLLLYSYAVNQSFDLRKFLTIFHVSRFMRPIWEQFSHKKNSTLLTIALIINEQQMLEERLLTRPPHSQLLKRLDFQLQENLGFTMVLFPYEQKKDTLTRMTGLVVKRFADLKSRILIGKKLYSLLFQDLQVLKGVLEFCRDVPHSGSRADYWSGVFSTKNRNRVYSPVLGDAWSDATLSYVPKNDWFVTDQSIKDVQSYPKVKRTDLTKQAYEQINMLQMINKTSQLITAENRETARSGQ